MLKVAYVVIIFAGTLLSAMSHETTRIISTRVGTYEGVIRDLDVFGETMKVEKYLGIPFAEPPIGPRRFRKPLIKAPMPPDEVYDATNYRASCKQIDIQLGDIRKPGMSIETSEDCLFLNIFKPYSDSIVTSLAVMVYIHGGGFVLGSPQLYPPDMLSAYTNVIVVHVSYRLAVWGFLSTGDETAPGNLGLWDQHIGLQWVHENIRDFGGDPNNVAIFGMSADAASVVYQSLFPRNKGFFQRSIAMSGSITCPWSFQERPLDITVRFADLLGCDTKVSKEKIVQCIESTPEEKLHATLNKKEHGFIKFPMEIVSVVDGEFLKANPLKVQSNFKGFSSESREHFASLDFMTGNVAGEGAMNIHHFVGVEDTENFALSRKEFEEIVVPKVAKLMYGDTVPDVVSDLIIHKYTNWENPDDVASIRKSFLKMTGDYVFLIHTKLVADLHANLSSKKKTFAYYFEAFPSQHYLWTPTWVSEPNHNDDLIFLLGYDKEGVLCWTGPYSQEYQPMTWELEISKLFMTLITNFVKTGDPNKPVNVEQMIGTTWPQYDALTGKYMTINRTMSKDSVRERLFAETYNFWFNLIPKVIQSAIHSADEYGSCDVAGNCPP